MTNPNSGGKIYYTTNGTDPRVYGSGAVSLSALAYTNPVVLNASTVIKARVLNGSWSALNEGDFSVALLGVPIRITEIMYNPIGGDAFEYLELQNIGVTTVDLSGYSFQGITYVFPNGTHSRSGRSHGACLVCQSIRFRHALSWCDRIRLLWRQALQ